MDNNEMPENLGKALEHVRIEGKTNMFDFPVVWKLMIEAGYEKEASWSLLNKDEFQKFFFAATWVTQ